jgi:hypothetical protein
MTIIDRYGRTEDERKALRLKVEAANQEATINWNKPEWRREMAAAMTETIYQGFQHENLLGLFAQVENAPFDGRVVVKETRGLRAYWVARGGYIEASTIHSESMELPRDTIGFHVEEFEDKLMTNFSETSTTLVDLAMQRLDAQVNQRVLALFQAAIGSSSAYYSSGSGITLARVNAAIRAVRDSSRSQNISIIGRATVTDQLVDGIMGGSSNGAGFLPETNEALLRTGVIGNYRGARIITLTNYLDDTDTSFFPANELYVVGDDASKFAFWGGLMFKEFVEPDNWYWHYLARRDFGGVVHRPDRLRRLIDSAISA